MGYFGNVALCVDWKMQADYIDPKVKVADSTAEPAQQQSAFNPTLDDCLKLYTAKEKIDYKCEKCKKDVVADIQLLISRLPDILIVLLDQVNT